MPLYDFTLTALTGYTVRAESQEAARKALQRHLNRSAHITIADPSWEITDCEELDSIQQNEEHPGVDLDATEGGSECPSTA